MQKLPLAIDDVPIGWWVLVCRPNRGPHAAPVPRHRGRAGRRRRGAWRFGLGQSRRATRLTQSRALAGVVTSGVLQRPRSTKVGPDLLLQLIPAGEKAACTDSTLSQMHTPAARPA